MGAESNCHLLGHGENRMALLRSNNLKKIH